MPKENNLQPECTKCWDKGYASWAYGTDAPEKIHIIKVFCTCKKGLLLGKGKRYGN